LVCLTVCPLGSRARSCVHSCVSGASPVRLGASPVRLRASSCVFVRLRASPCVSVRPISPNWGKRGFLHALKPRHSVNYARLEKTLLRTKVAHFPKQPGSTQPSRCCTNHKSLQKINFSYPCTPYKVIGVCTNSCTLH
jgi:hypothetical protein